MASTQEINHILVPGQDFDIQDDDNISPPKTCKPICVVVKLACDHKNKTGDHATEVMNEPCLGSDCHKCKKVNTPPMSKTCFHECPQVIGHCQTHKNCFPNPSSHDFFPECSIPECQHLEWGHNGLDCEERFQKGLICKDEFAHLSCECFEHSHSGLCALRLFLLKSCGLFGCHKPVPEPSKHGKKHRGQSPKPTL
mmetsp:Transcript_5078/g.5707  ORF Transcript_5078/g.5707 Transcript_5078/m.5707 type:complete len:196 (+) Transcript_5078:3500-4087(+)